MRSKLIVYSVPFQRLFRTHLNPELLQAMAEDADLLIVSPFAGNVNFDDQVNNQGARTIKPPNIDDLNWFLKKLIAISSVMRTEGFLRKREII